YSLWPFEDFPHTPTMKIKRFEVQGFIAKKQMPQVHTYEDRLNLIISKFTNKRVTENSKLTDLGLTSLDRVQLVSDIEDTFNVEIDESQITSNTIIKDLQKLLHEQKRKKQLQQRRWVLSFPIRIVRFILQWTIFIPFAKSHCKITNVEGKENLANINQPVIFASNHESHLDSAIIIAALPFRFSTKTAIATLLEYFERQSWLKRAITYNLATIAGNSYMFSQEKYIRTSIRYTGELLDKGWNILIFPEGERTTTGRMRKLKPGIGLLINEMKVPVVPIKLDGTFEIWPRFKKWPSYGKATVKFGKPLYFSKESPQEITKKIEKELRSL
ncbi:MAG: 1-acyl-sn-glycerol-3-phosphate acyltransferase, partial [Candidatus Woesearchaeota archaeon]